jgi:HD superfamily phosphohydrolase
MKHAAIISAIEKDFVHPVRDPLWKHIYLSRPLEKIIRTAPFLRLGSIKQLGPAALVYPGATHTRQNHSLGVYHLAKRIITHLLKQEGCPDLTLEGVKAFLTASLLHDLGHFPYAHVLEDDLALTDHEALSGQYILGSEIQKIIQNDLGSDPLLTAAIIDQDLDYPHSPGELKFFRKLLSGVLDPDKLDYLNRDAYFCGIPYGVQDIDFVISQIQPHKENGMAIGPKGVMAVENILFSKYLMYKSVYWHKGVRTTSSIVKKGPHLSPGKRST